MLQFCRNLMETMLLAHLLWLTFFIVKSVSLRLKKYAVLWLQFDSCSIYIRDKPDWNVAEGVTVDVWASAILAPWGRASVRETLNKKTNTPSHRVLFSLSQLFEQEYKFWKHQVINKIRVTGHTWTLNCSVISVHVTLRFCKYRTDLGRISNWKCYSNTPV